MPTRVLTGITTTGVPHLGNYVGAIRPALAASRAPGIEAFYFLADYHALVKCDVPQQIARSRHEVAAAWLAAGLDLSRVTFYRQSDVPEILELCWILTCVTAKGLLNRAHAYKAAVAANRSKGIDGDAAITAGLYLYPVLMAADILLFNATQVPVGPDQVQHIEMARVIAQRFNHKYAPAWRLAGGDGMPFILPNTTTPSDIGVLPGLDGRKMSKSYGNAIPLFTGGDKATRAAIMRIVTDSSLPGEPKDPDASVIYRIFSAFATREESEEFRQALIDGMGWGDAKERLCARVEQYLAPMRERYAELVRHPMDIEDHLKEGAARARAIAGPRLETLRRTIGFDRS